MLLRLKKKRKKRREKGKELEKLYLPNKIHTHIIGVLENKFFNGREKYLWIYNKKNKLSEVQC